MSIELPGPEVETTSVRIRLDRALPLVCVLCGKPAAHSVQMKFAKSKSGSGTLGSVLVTAAMIAFAGVHGFGFASRQRDEEMHDIRIPLCGAHRKFRHAYQERSFLAGLFVLLSIIAAVAFVVMQSSGTAGPESSAYTIGFLLATGLFALFSIVAIRGLMKENLIRGKSVTDQRMVLEGVAAGFAKAVEERNRKETEHVDSFLDDLQ